MRSPWLRLFSSQHPVLRFLVGKVWIKDRVGGGVAPSDLPHHRTNGSVYGGSNKPLRISHITLWEVSVADVSGRGSEVPISQAIGSERLHACGRPRHYTRVLCRRLPLSWLGMV